MDWYTPLAGLWRITRNDGEWFVGKAIQIGWLYQIELNEMHVIQFSKTNLLYCNGKRRESSSNSLFIQINNWLDNCIVYILYILCIHLIFHFKYCTVLWNSPNSPLVLLRIANFTHFFSYFDFHLALNFEVIFWFYISLIFLNFSIFGFFVPSELGEYPD